MHAAEVVVRARALEQRRPPGMRGFPSAEVEFEVLEVLKGPEMPETFWMRAAISDKDDFNSGAVPYLQMRHGQARGSCHAYFHAKGGEFLLLLRGTHGELTPYWAPLMPTNEQVRGAADPWVVWVRGEIERARPAAVEVGQSMA